MVSTVTKLLNEEALSNPSHDGYPSSKVYDLCCKRAWHQVVQLCQSNPLDAQYQCDDGLALHIACKFRSPVRVVRALLEAYPTAASLPNFKGELALHEACRYNASVSVIRELTKCSPASALVQPSPLYTLFLSRETTESNRDHNNTAVLWHTEKDDLQPVLYLTLFWQKVQVLLEAAATHRQQRQRQDMTKLFILHAAVSIPDCPIEIILFCLSEYPEQIRLSDGCGRLPLHVAVGRSISAASTSLLGKLLLREKSIVIRLLEIYPEAAKIMDPNEPVGRYPLHTALSNGHEWHGGVKELFYNCPDAGSVQDPTEGLHPFQMVTCDVDSVFHLLRHMPSTLTGMRAKPDFVEYEKAPLSNQNSTCKYSAPTNESALCDVRREALAGCQFWLEVKMLQGFLFSTSTVFTTLWKTMRKSFSLGDFRQQTPSEFK